MCKEYVDYNFSQWKKLQSCITKVAEQVYGRRKYVKKQPWITIEMWSRMNEKSKLKTTNQQRGEYKESCREVQRQFRLPKETYYDRICKELEDQDRKHNPKLYTRTKDLQLRKPCDRTGLKSKEGKMLLTIQKVLYRWEE